MNSAAIDITDQFAQVYYPHKALLFYRHTLEKENIYIEKFDCNKKGQLTNAHPLSKKEIGELAKLFERQKVTNRFLQCEGILPHNILHLNTINNCVIWHTPAEQHHLHFSRSLDLNDGNIALPALIWKGTPTDLSLFAVKEQQRPTASTILYHAPFFNVHDDGRICMGTVDVDMKRCTGLKNFISQWERYFFNSKFSHTIGNKNHTKTDITTVYRKLLNTSTSFPEKELIPIKRKLEQILI